MVRHRSVPLRESGFSLVEVTIALAVGAIVALGYASLLSDQQKAMRGVSAKIEAENMRKIMQEILSDENSCAASVKHSNPTAPTSMAAPMNLTNVIRRSYDTTTGSWTNTTHYAVGTTYGNLVRISSLTLRDHDPALDLTPGPKFDAEFTYVGTVTGPQSIRRVFDAFVTFGPSSSDPTYAFRCSTMPAGGGNSSMDYSAYLAGGATWTGITLSSSGGFGAIAGGPPYSLGTNGQFPCGPLATVTLTEPSVTDTTRAALISFVNSDANEKAPMIRVLTMTNRLVAQIGQSGRSGDGRSFGLGGEVVVPLTSRQFKMQSCRRDGDAATYYYAVKGVVD